MKVKGISRSMPSIVAPFLDLVALIGIGLVSFVGKIYLKPWHLPYKLVGEFCKFCLEPFFDQTQSHRNATERRSWKIIANWWVKLWLRESSKKMKHKDSIVVNIYVFCLFGKLVGLVIQIDTLPNWDLLRYSVASTERERERGRGINKMWNIMAYHLVI